jgi:hypothetical protein
MRDTIELAREAGWPIEAGNELPDTGGMCFKTFEALVRADERKACAKVCEGLQDCGPENGCCPTYWNEALEKAEVVIRARGENT